METNRIIKKRFKGFIALTCAFLMFMNPYVAGGLVQAATYYVYNDNENIAGDTDPEWYQEGDRIFFSGESSFYFCVEYTDENGDVTNVTDNVEYNPIVFTSDNDSLNTAGYYLPLNSRYLYMGNFYSNNASSGDVVIPIDCSYDCKAQYYRASINNMLEGDYAVDGNVNVNDKQLVCRMTLTAYRSCWLVYRNQFGDMEEPQTTEAVRIHDQHPVTIALPEGFTSPGEAYELKGFSLSSDLSTLDFENGESLSDLDAYTDYIESVPIAVGENSTARDYLYLYPIWEIPVPPSEEPSEPPSSEPLPEQPQQAESLNTTKSNGTATVTMGNYFYGGAGTNPSVRSDTNSTTGVQFYYKAVGASEGSYSQTKPTTIGNYQVKAVLPANEKYNEVTATATFSISYLPLPQQPYSITTEKPANGREQKGWYASNVIITPQAGYQIAAADGKFTDKIVFEEGNQTTGFVLLKIGSGEMTDTTAAMSVHVDTIAPKLSIENNHIFYGNDSDKDELVLPIDELSECTLREVKKSEEVEQTTGVNLLSEENSNHALFTEGKIAFHDGKLVFNHQNKPQTYELELIDNAGNQAKYLIRVCPAWMKDGVVPEGTVYLESGVQYFLGDGNWSINEEATIYVGNTSFYATEGEYTFHKRKKVLHM